MKTGFRARDSGALSLAVISVGLGLGCTSSPKVSAPSSRPYALELLQHRRWSPRIGQGAEPKNDEDFRLLAAAGYTVILSVDGATTDPAAAEKHGLRYLHVPIGYDGVDRTQAVSILKAVTSAEGPVYVHCHHGRHRGPAAAALARIAVDGVSSRRAVTDLMLTLSPAYPGLRRDVAEFVPPTAEELARAPTPVSQVHPSDLVEHMLEIDDRWDHLQTAREQGWRVDPQHPDLAPSHEARLLVEALAETVRLTEDDVPRLGAPFWQRLAQASLAASDLEAALQSGDLAAADRAAVQIKQSCMDCHQRFRN